MFTAVYGLHTVEDRKVLWTDLSNMAPQLHNTPWLIMGDLNAVMYSSDRINGVPVTLHEMQDLNDFVDSLVDVKSTGHFDSWSSKGDGHARISSRIDSCFANFGGGGVFESRSLRSLTFVFAPNQSSHGRPFSSGFSTIFVLILDLSWLSLKLGMRRCLILV